MDQTVSQDPGNSQDPEIEKIINDLYPLLEEYYSIWVN
jgi:hypothetical protein